MIYETGVFNFYYLALISCSIANTKPLPTDPNTFSFGILTFSNIKLQVGEALIPSLSSFLPNIRPGVGIGTRNAVMPII